MINIDLKTLKQNSTHFPVLINEIMQHLPPTDSKSIILDCTFGAGGYTKHILQHTKANVIAIDRDHVVEGMANDIIGNYKTRLSFFLSTFSNFNKILDNLNIKQVDAIILDLGLSTLQLKGDRGFSFKDKSTLSMQMGVDSLDTHGFLNFAAESLIADVIYYYGEEPRAKVIARNIVNYRKDNEITTTDQLVGLILSSGVYAKNIHPATKAMQAIRIYINNELAELQAALFKSIDYLKQEGRLMVVSFHSLEDKIVKDFIKKPLSLAESVEKFTSYKLNTAIINDKEIFSTLSKKPIIASQEETKINPPSRSAKLRVAIKNI